MKIKTSDRRDLPVFSISIQDMKEIVNKLKRDRFYPSEVNIKIDVNVSEEKELNFDNFKEFDEYNHDVDSYEYFTIWLRPSDDKFYGKPTYISRTLGLGRRNGAYVKAEADDELWCKGTTNLACNLFLRHKKWYDIFFRLPSGTAVTILGACLYIWLSFLTDSENSSTATLYIGVALLASFFLAVACLILRRITKPALIVITEKKRFKRRYWIAFGGIIYFIASLLALLKVLLE